MHYDVISGPKWTGPDWSRAFLESICPMDLKSKVSAFSSKTQENIDLDLYYKVCEQTEPRSIVCVKKHISSLPR